MTKLDELKNRVELLDEYEDACGQAGKILSWQDWLGSQDVSEQDCINARIALRGPPVLD